MEEKSYVVDKLYKRDAKRVELLQQQHKLKDEINASNEQLDYFHSIFKEKFDNIDYALSKAGSLPKCELSAHFDNIKTDLRDLQKYVAASSLFLKDFNMRKSQASIQNLQFRSTELESLYFPKKKFGFNKKTFKKQHNGLEDITKDSVDSNIQLANKNNWGMVTCGFTNRKNERLALDQDNVSKKDVSLSFLTSCVVIIKGNPATLHLDNLSNCIILCGPVSTSVFVDKCTDCKMILACQQLRFHTSTLCDVYLHVTSKAIIEDCNKINVAPYNLKYDGLDKDFAMSSLDLNVNNWNKLDDFNWLASDMSSPNWQILDEALRNSSWDIYMN